MGEPTNQKVAQGIAWEIAREIAQQRALFGVDLSPTISEANFQNMQVI